MLNMNARCLFLIAFLFLSALLPAWAGEPQEVTTPLPSQLPTQLRRPVALGWLNDGLRLVVANRRSGTLSLLNTDSWSVINEFPAGKQLSDMAVLPGGKQLFVTDEAGHELIALRYGKDALQETARLPVSPSPVELILNDDATRCYVASLWSRRLTIVSVSTESDSNVELQILKTVALPFEPRKLLLFGDAGLLIVADAFGGQLALVETESGEVASVRDLPAHNLQGLTLNHAQDAVLITHQHLNPLARATFNDLHWGMLSNNVARPISVQRLLSPTANLLDGRGAVRLGDVGHGAADPADIALLDKGRIAIALAGTGEVAITDIAGRDMRRYKTGRRPTALLTAVDSDKVIVANTLSDSISVIDPSADPPVRDISLGPTPEPSPQTRGELLFFDAGISHDSWLSCHSCHTDGHTSGLTADTLGDGSYGAPKRIPTLLGVSQTDLWAWNGSMKELHDQIDQSIRTTLHGDPPSGEAVNDLAAYLQTLNPPPPLRPQTIDKEDEASLTRGQSLFHEMNCIQCHVPPVTYTTGGVFDVDLVDEVGNRKFNPPSLRGVGRRRGFFHDKRAKTLGAVFTDHQHQLDRDLGTQELKDLVRFLESL